VTVELNDYHPDDIEEIVVAWLAPLCRCGVAREVGDPLPFILVRHITGPENIDAQTADPVVSVHTLCDKKLGYGAAKRQAALTHDRMTLWGRHHDTVILPSDGSEAAIDYLQVFEAPTWQIYADVSILRKVGRYQIGLSYVANPLYELPTSPPSPATATLTLTGAPVVIG
jgi:hypothetical protein